MNLATGPSRHFYSGLQKPSLARKNKNKIIGFVRIFQIRFLKRRYGAGGI
jgi:hypothetical protein